MRHTAEHQSSENYSQLAATGPEIGCPAGARATLRTDSEGSFSAMVVLLGTRRTVWGDATPRARPEIPL